MSLKSNGFEVILVSAPEYDRLTAEIFFDGKFVALVSHERAEGDFDIETPGSGLEEEYILRKVNLRGFQDAVLLACKRLMGDVK